MTDFFVFFIETLDAVWLHAFGASSRLAPIYLAFTLVMCLVLYFYRRVEKPFLAWALPKETYFHPSHMIDIKLFVLGRVLAALGLFQMVWVGASVATLVGGLFPQGPVISPLSPVLVALLLLVINDFGVYWVHRVHHQTAALWPLHAVHHSAEVMTPITVYRKHPAYDLISSMVRGLLLGVLQGVFIGLFADKMSFVALVGINAGYFLFNALGANLRHTHIWLGYGRVLERVLISPAQHQIHHSLTPRHHNKNYGEVLAIWDWMFGTLHLSHGEEGIAFGLADETGRRLPQPHDTLKNALVGPLVEMGAAVRRSLPGEARQ